MVVKHKYKVVKLASFYSSKIVKKITPIYEVKILLLENELGIINQRN